MAAQQTFEEELKKASSAYVQQDNCCKVLGHFLIIHRLSTGIFQWKPDYLSATQHFGRAIKSLRAARMNAKLAETLVRRADCHVKLGNHLGAGIDFEDAAKALKLGKLATAGTMSVSDLYSSAVLQFSAANKTERAAAAQLQVLQLACASGNLSGASEAIRVLTDMYSNTEKPVYAADKGKAAMTMLLRARMYRSAMTLMASMLQWFSALKQPHNVAKMVLSRIILLLADGEVAGARRELNTASSLDGFVVSAECEAAERLIAAVEAGDEDAVKQTATKSFVTALDNQVCRVAQSGLLQGKKGDRVAPAASEESASMSAALKAAQHPVHEQGVPDFVEAGSSQSHAERAELFAPPTPAQQPQAAPGATPAAQGEGEADLL